MPPYASRYKKERIEREERNWRFIQCLPTVLMYHWLVAYLRLSPQPRIDGFTNRRDQMQEQWTSCVNKTPNVVKLALRLVYSPL
jgi:hypothetical protein